MADRDLNYNATVNAEGVVSGMKDVEGALRDTKDQLDDLGGSDGLVNVTKEMRTTQRELGKLQTGAERYQEAMARITRQRDAGEISGDEFTRLRGHHRRARAQDMLNMVGLGRFGPMAAVATGVAAVKQGIDTLIRIQREHLAIAQRGEQLGLDPRDTHMMDRFQRHMVRIGAMDQGRAGAAASRIAEMAQASGRTFEEEVQLGYQLADQAGLRGRQREEFFFERWGDRGLARYRADQLMRRRAPGESTPGRQGMGRLLQRLWNASTANIGEDFFQLSPGAAMNWVMFPYASSLTSFKAMNTFYQDSRSGPFTNESAVNHIGDDGGLGGMH